MSESAFFFWGESDNPAIEAGYCESGGSFSRAIEATELIFEESRRSRQARLAEIWICVCVSGMICIMHIDLDFRCLSPPSTG